MNDLCLDYGLRLVFQVVFRMVLQEDPFSLILIYLIHLRQSLLWLLRLKIEAGDGLFENCLEDISLEDIAPCIGASEFPFSIWKTVGLTPPSGT